MNTTSNTYPGTCTACGTTVETGAGTVAKVNSEWAVSHTDCTPTAMTAIEVATMFPDLTARQLDTIIDVNLTEDEIDDSTGIINQAGVSHIAKVAANNAAYKARLDEQAAKAMAAYRLTDAYRDAHATDQQ